jgi:tryptophanyl-tRNA synthetase
MSKSYGNIIDIFLPDKELLKQVKSIKTDSTPMESPKDPEGDTVYALYKLLATPEQTKLMADKYRAGNYGYGHAKQELFDLIVQKFKKEREAFNFYMDNTEELEKKLIHGEEKARVVAQKVLRRARKNLGFN